MQPILVQSLSRTWSGRTYRNCQNIRLLSSTQRSSKLRARLEIPPPFPVTKTCPESSCNCPPTPALPEGLPIDHEQALNGTMAAYAQQLLICTGQPDWTSRIEDDGENKGWGNLVRGLKRLLGRGGPYLDVIGSYNPRMDARTLADTRSPQSSLSIMFWLRIHLSRQLPASPPPPPRHSSSPASNTSPQYL
jgi:hypothetical protein